MIITIKIDKFLARRPATSSEGYTGYALSTGNEQLTSTEIFNGMSHSKIFLTRF
ncbi:MAG: hypothetical protein FWD60_10995 [Candidatus Azobacteroides sp.]|nr:hypothetical protein [Candidatus Azobacteroides sp.]